MADKLTRRTETRRVMCGRVPIGGGAPIAIQSMANTPAGDAEAALGVIMGGFELLEEKYPKHVRVREKF